MTISYQTVIDFLYTEAKLLDTWKLLEWAELFTDDAVYVVPPIGEPDAISTKSMFYIHDNRNRIQDRAERLLKKEAHVEFPHSTTLRNYNNIIIKNLDSDVIEAECNFTTYRIKREVMDCFIGVHQYELVRQEENLKIRRKKVILSLDSLRPQGKISLIL